EKEIKQINEEAKNPKLKRLRKRIASKVQKEKNKVQELADQEEKSRVQEKGMVACEADC
ncbi:hypothetical protein Tco_0574769, partial [Tanacetum coccineum]